METLADRIMTRYPKFLKVTHQVKSEKVHFTFTSKSFEFEGTETVECIVPISKIEKVFFSQDKNYESLCECQKDTKDKRYNGMPRKTISYDHICLHCGNYCIVNIIKKHSHLFAEDIEDISSSIFDNSIINSKSCNATGDYYTPSNLPFFGIKT